jgi:erythromycin esterase-like protein
MKAIRGELAAEGTERPRLVVWAHNTHVGDARATEVARRGELDLGQLAREALPGRTLSVGFTTFAGNVMAAREWGGTGERRAVSEALNESYEALFHRAAATVGSDALLLDLRGRSPLAAALRAPRLERAIGVIYQPETERASHYFETTLPDQFDVVIHVDWTTAVRPIAGVADDGPGAPAGGRRPRVT